MTAPDTPEAAGMRTIQCPGCNGDGYFEVVTGYDSRDGSPQGFREQCRECEGKGFVEVEPTDDEDDPQ